MTSDRIGEPEVRELPRWARLSLALRCLRRARALIHPSTEQALVLDGALDRIDQAVHAGRAGDELADAAAATYTLALDNLDSPPLTPSAADYDVTTCLVAHATAFAAEAATLAAAQPAAHLLAQSIDFAVHAYRLAGMAGSATALAGMRADLERLRGATGWTDETPVPAGFFGAM
jgi:hypothetical protein